MQLPPPSLPIFLVFAIACVISITIFTSPGRSESDTHDNEELVKLKRDNIALEEQLKTAILEKCSNKNDHQELVTLKQQNTSLEEKLKKAILEQRSNKEDYEELVTLKQHNTSLEGQLKAAISEKCSNKNDHQELVTLKQQNTSLEGQLEKAILEQRSNKDDHQELVTLKNRVTFVTKYDDLTKLNNISKQLLHVITSRAPYTDVEKFKSDYVQLMGSTAYNSLQVKNPNTIPPNLNNTTVDGFFPSFKKYLIENEKSITELRSYLSDVDNLKAFTTMPNLVYTIPTSNSSVVLNIKGTSALFEYPHSSFLNYMQGSIKSISSDSNPIVVTDGDISIEATEAILTKLFSNGGTFIIEWVGQNGNRICIEVKNVIFDSSRGKNDIYLHLVYTDNYIATIPSNNKYYPGNEWNDTNVFPTASGADIKIYPGTLQFKTLT